MRRAFTLVELLVVVAIIALLLAILLPALGKARALARSVACLSNVRSLNVAVNFYASDNADFLPPNSIDASFEGGAHVPADYQQSGAPNAVRPQHPVLLGQYTGISDDQVAWGRITDRTPWRCVEHDVRSNDTNDVSYSFINRTSGNGAGNFFPNIANNASGVDRWATLPKAGQVDNPGIVMTFADMAVLNGKIPWSIEGSWPKRDNMGVVRLYGNPGNTGTTGFSPKNLPRKAFNHRMRHPPFANGSTPTGTNMGFVDGHAATITNTPSDVDGEFWLNDTYGVDFVFRPQDY